MNWGKLNKILPLSCSIQQFEEIDLLRTVSDIWRKWRTRTEQWQQNQRFDVDRRSGIMASSVIMLQPDFISSLLSFHFHFWRRFVLLFEFVKAFVNVRRFVFAFSVWDPSDFEWRPFSKRLTSVDGLLMILSRLFLR